MATTRQRSASRGEAAKAARSAVNEKGVGETRGTSSDGQKPRAKLKAHVAAAEPSRRPEKAFVEEVHPTFAADSADIIVRIGKWAGGYDQALAWYRAQPISAFGDRTAESLVKTGQAEALRDYLDSVALGGFA